jgi:hypothetical protein
MMRRATRLDLEATKDYEYFGVGFWYAGKDWRYRIVVVHLDCFVNFVVTNVNEFFCFLRLIVAQIAVFNNRIVDPVVRSVVLSSRHVTSSIVPLQYSELPLS